MEYNKTKGFAKTFDFNENIWREFKTLQEKIKKLDKTKKLNPVIQEAIRNETIIMRQEYIEMKTKSPNNINHFIGSNGPKRARTFRINLGIWNEFVEYNKKWNSLAKVHPTIKLWQRTNSALSNYMPKMRNQFINLINQNKEKLYGPSQENQERTGSEINSQSIS